MSRAKILSTNRGVQCRWTMLTKEEEVFIFGGNFDDILEHSLSGMKKFSKGLLMWVRSQYNKEFHFLKTNCLYENGFIPPWWDLTSTQVRSHSGGMIFLHVKGICQTVPTRQNYYLAWPQCVFRIIPRKSAIHFTKSSSTDVYE